MIKCLQSNNIMALDLKHYLISFQSNNRMDGKEARLADYFDVIAGTSTKSLMTTMLTVGNEDRPLYATKDIIPFYLELRGLFASIINMLKLLIGPKYNVNAHYCCPTFDIRSRQRKVFSTYEAKASPSSSDFELCDVCISPSAAPIYLPLHHFKMEYMISFGTGRSHEPDKKYTYKNASKWGVSWVDETLTGTESSVDIATKDNLDRLFRIGKNLLKKQVSRVNLDTGLSEPIENGGTNADALKRFAVLLSDKRKLRQLRSPAQL
ncbi:hypothetical protein M9H77_36193 [Catharanthus roseus]|uniref:Uncharacterized protein n=1 Tax=Catharanthus roseus TaxID=4058 RepID=A0ACB9ZRX8_CATRO|nr:hypothetical protein M9H77_36193 [Catharanthus roseus]